MKQFKTMIAALFLTLSIFSTSWAGLSPVIEFMAINNDGGSVPLDLALFSIDASLLKSTDNTNWSEIAFTEIVPPSIFNPLGFKTATLDLPDTTHLYLRMDIAGQTPGAPQAYFAGGDGNGLYNSMLITWMPAFSYLMIAPENNDKLAPSSVPIPSAVLLLGSGLLGLVGIRRRNQSTPL
jgi:hypothetical protein